VQICDGETVLLFHVGTGVQPGPALVALLADPRRLKAGVAVRGDALKLLRDFPACGANPPAGLVELSHVARALEPRRWASRSLVALRRLTQGLLRKDLDKGPVRTGAWDQALSDEQIECE
jgi:ribonuclease D